jgi:two-component system, NarL family, sensor histidine kinase UhpB
LSLPVALALLVSSLLIFSGFLPFDTRSLHPITSAPCQIAGPNTGGNDGLESGQSCSFIIEGFDDILERENLNVSPSSSVAFLITDLRDVVKITVNGTFVGEASSYMFRLPSRLTTPPSMILVPALAFMPYGNIIEVTVSAGSGNSAYMGELFFGDEPRVTQTFRRLWFVEVVLPKLLLGGQLFIATMFLIIWRRQQSERAFGWLALVLILDIIRGAALIPALGFEKSGVFYSALLMPFCSTAYYFFTREITSAPKTRAVIFVWLLPALVAGVALALPQGVAVAEIWPWGALLIALNLFMSIFVLFRAWHQENAFEIRLLLICTCLLLGALIHDLLMASNLTPTNVGLARPSFMILLIAMIFLMIDRYTNAIDDIAEHANRLLQQKYEIENRLKIAYERIAEDQGHLILAHERTRLMRDLHDGLGGEMIAVLALAEGRHPVADDIAHHARSALTDMRLIVASLEDFGGDISLALGTWKERAEPQVLSAGLRFLWKITESSGRPDTSPTLLLNLLRILQEALSNTLRHANATQIKFSTEETEGYLVIVVEDDGDGFKENSRRGRGVSNMHARALAFSGHLEIEPSQSGTLVKVHVPFKK